MHALNISYLIIKNQGFHTKKLFCKLILLLFVSILFTIFTSGWGINYNNIINNFVVSVSIIMGFLVSFLGIIKMENNTIFCKYKGESKDLEENKKFKIFNKKFKIRFDLYIYYKIFFIIILGIVFMLLYFSVAFSGIFNNIGYITKKILECGFIFYVIFYIFNFYELIIMLFSVMVDYDAIEKQ